MQHYFETLKGVMSSSWDSVALANFKGEEFTFRALSENIVKFGLFFEAAGLKKGDKVAIYSNNSARWAVSFLSINAYQTVVVPLLSDFHPDNACELVNHSEAVLLFADKDHLSKMDTSKMTGIRGIVVIDDFSIQTEDEALKAAYEGTEAAFAAKYPEGLKPEDVQLPTDNWKDLAVINYTSGTTSAPKGVMLRYECLCGSIDFATRYIPCSNKDNIVSMLPMGHIYGMVFEFMYPLCNGVSVYYLGKAPSPSLLLKAMKEVKPYIVITVPLVMEKIYKASVKPALSKWPVNFLKHVPVLKDVVYKAVRTKLLEAFGGNVYEFIMGGAALNPEVEKAFRTMKLPYTVGYGMTEAAPLLAYADYKLYKQGSCGKYVDFAEVRIDSEDPENVVGEIQAKGLNICSGYFNNPEASAGAFTEDGYLHTGDLGVMDKNGNITIRGRSKNMILSANGQNIYPEEVEAVVNAQDWVIESVVVDRAAKLVGLVYLDKEGAAKAGLSEDAIAAIPEAVRAAANKLLPSYSQLTKMEVVDEPFAKTPKMSIKRFMYK